MSDEGSGDLPALARNLRRLRYRKGMTQLEVAQALGHEGTGQVSRWENGDRLPDRQNLIALARVLAVTVEELTTDPALVPPSDVLFEENPRPVAYANITAKNVYVIFEEANRPIDLSIRYLREPLRYAPDLAPLKERLTTLARDRTHRAGGSYFNLPNARIIRVSEEGNYVTDTGEEKKRVVVEMGPVSWDEFSFLNTFLDMPVFRGKGPSTIRERYCDLQTLYRRGSDLRWCALSNCTACLLAPITDDGYAIIQRRSNNVSFMPGRFTSGVGEGINRFADDAHPKDLFRRLNSDRLGEDYRTVDYTYKSRGVPSPYLAALRGVGEELSPTLERHLAAAPNFRIRFLKFIMDCELFNPLYVGVVELGLDRRTVEKVVREDPGKDQRSETLGLEFLKLDVRNERTARFVDEQRRWTPGGLATFLTALKFWNR